MIKLYNTFDKKGYKSQKRGTHKGDKRGVKLTKTQFEVLKAIQDNLTITEIANYRKTKRSSVYKTLKLLTKKGMAEKIGYSYQATQKGIEGLHSFIGLKYNLRQHNLHIKLKVLDSQRNWDKKRNRIVQLPFFNKRVELKNNYYDLFNYGRLQIKTTSQSIIFKLPTIYAKTVDSAVLQAMDILFSAVPKVEAEFNVKLIKNYKCNMTIISQEYARINDALARLYRKEAEKLYIADEEGKVWLIADYSFNNDELETIDPNKSPDDMTIVNKFMNDLRANPTTLSEINNVVAKEMQLAHNIQTNQQLMSQEFANYGIHIKSHIKAIQTLSNGVNKWVDGIERNNAIMLEIKRLLEERQ
jgi:DNA-binding CsgD family transcriptional regulator